MSHSPESSSTFEPADKAEKQSKLTDNQMSEIAIKQWQDIRKLLPSHLLNNGNHSCFGDQPILPRITLNQTNSENNSFKDQLKELANSSQQFAANYARGVIDIVQGTANNLTGLGNNLRDFGLGFADGATGTIKGTVKILQNPGETVQNISHTISTNAQYLLHTPINQQVKDLRKTGLAAEQEIINKFGHSLTAREVGKILGEHIYLELPIVPKIFKLAMPEKKLVETAAELTSELPKAPAAQTPVELPTSPDQKIIPPRKN